MQAFIQFMNGAVGRGVRIVAGLALIAVGLFVVGGTAGAVVAAVGLMPLAMGAMGHCLIGDVAGSPH